MMRPVVALGLTGVGLMALAYRQLYRHVLHKTEAELERLLGAVAGDMSRKALLGE